MTSEGWIIQHLTSEAHYIPADPLEEDQCPPAQLQVTHKEDYK